MAIHVYVENLHWAIHCLTANFGPLLRGSMTNPMLITVFDTHLISKSLGFSQDPSNSERSALTHFFMSLAHKYINLKEPQDIKEQVTSKSFFFKKAGFTWNPQPQRHSVQKVFFKLNPGLWCFNNISTT